MFLYKRLRAHVIRPSRSSAIRRVVVASDAFLMQKGKMQILAKSTLVNLDEEQSPTF